MWILIYENNFTLFWGILSTEAEEPFMLNLYYNTWSLLWRHLNINVSLRCRKALGMWRLKNKFLCLKTRGLRVATTKREGLAHSLMANGLCSQLHRQRNSPFISLREIWLQKSLYFTHLVMKQKWKQSRWPCKVWLAKKARYFDSC